MRWHLLLVAIGGSAALFQPRPAHAELVTFSFEGQLTELLGDVTFLGNSIQVGTTFTGSYTFDSTTPDGNSGYPGVGWYDNALTAFALDIGPHLLTGTGLSDTIQVENKPEYDAYLMQDLSPRLLSRNAFVTMFLADAEASIFASDALPLFPPEIAFFEQRDFQISGGPNSYALLGQVSTLAPEGFSLAVWIVGALLLLRGRR